MQETPRHKSLGSIHALYNPELGSQTGFLPTWQPPFCFWQPLKGAGWGREVGGLEEELTVPHLWLVLPILPIPSLHRARG